MSTAANQIEIIVTRRKHVDAMLDAAVHELQQLATHTARYGILITRYHPGHYTAALSDQVPFGLTRERTH